MYLVLLLTSLIAAALAGLRWLRVAQREHYLAGAGIGFARRWWLLGPNRLLAAAAVVGLSAAALGAPLAGLVGAVAVAAGPFGLSLRGRSSPLAWTRRLRTLAGVSAALVAVVVALAALAGGARTAGPVALLVAALTPLVVDGAMAATAPLERRLAEPFVVRAGSRLREVAPTVVAITGSYGKTSTKGYVAHLLSGTRTVVPTPASFNNRSGLARAINEHLVPGTEVFVAEMGTYGPGEIADMCSWVPPDVAVITAIGPVHLERMGSEQRIAEAKAEILERASTVVLNIDYPLLAERADEVAAGPGTLWRCSSVDRRADVCVVDDDGLLRVFVAGGRQLAAATVDAPPGNVACAVAVALALGVGEEEVARRLPGLPTAAHRRQVTTGSSGATVIDDTYNANPAGARAALATLARLGTSGRRIVVTPGMVELGDRQDEENRRFASDAAAVATDLVVVGATNASALVSGAEGTATRVVRAPNRQQAVTWVAGVAGPGDVVLYENDLPDHFP